MAETPFNPEAAGAESTADEQPIAAAAAPTPDPGEPEAPVSEPPAAEPAAPGVVTPEQPTGATPVDGAPVSEPVVDPVPAPQPVDDSVVPEPAAPITPAPSAPPLSAVSQPEQAPPPAAEPGVAARFEVPALEGAAPEGEGGEWELLKAKLQQWFQGGELQRQWDRLQGPLRGLALLIGLVLLLRLYGGLLGTIDSLPLVPGLLELVGVIAFLHFCLTRLVRTQERERLVADWSRRWQEFRGRG